MTNVAQVALLLVCALCIDRVGRKAWMIGAFGLGGVLLATLAFGAADQVAWVIVLSTLSYSLIGSIAAVVYLYTPEIYSTRMRAIGTGLATSWLRAASVGGPTLIGFMLGGGGVDRVFLMFGPDHRDPQHAPGGHRPVTPPLAARRQRPYLRISTTERR